MLAERADPRDTELPGRAALLRSDGSQGLDQREVLLDVFFTEAREAAAHVALGQVVDTLDLSGEEASTEGTVMP